MNPAAASPARKLRDDSLKIIAKSLFRELKEKGYDSRQIVSLSTELLGLVTAELQHPVDATANING